MDRSAEGVQLMLRLLESRELLFTHAALCDYHGRTGEALIDCDWLQAVDHEKVVTLADDEEDRLLAVDYDHHRGEAGSYHPRLGWAGIRQRCLKRYKPDIGRILTELLHSELRLPARGPADLSAGFVWDLGHLRLRRSGLTSVWLARRLSDRTAVDRLTEAASRRPPSEFRLVLTTTAHERLHALPPPMMRIISIADVLATEDPSRVDMNMLRARFEDRAPPDPSVPLHLSEDGILTINGVEQLAFTGEAQIRILRVLVDAHRSGRRLRAALILKRADSKVRTLQQAFGRKWRGLSPYLDSKNGFWGFSIDR